MGNWACGKCSISYPDRELSMNYVSCTIFCFSIAFTFSLFFSLSEDFRQHLPFICCTIVHCTSQTKQQRAPLFFVQITSLPPILLALAPIQCTHSGFKFLICYVRWEGVKSGHRITKPLSTSNLPIL